MKKTLIIAEAGVNHNGDISIAKKLIDVAAEAGVDYLKFQTFKAEKLVTKSADRAAYQNANTGNRDSQFEMLKKLELSANMHKELMAYCEKKNIQFLSTAFDLESMAYLRDIGITIAKIPSGEITNLPYLRMAAKSFSEIILSTGMAEMQEVKDAYKVLIENGAQHENITILHCNTEYPTPYEDVNLLAMINIKNKLGVKVGYSDHTLGIEIPIAAVALGACVIEKHFTLDRNMVGPDHKASLEPDELKAMVSAIRNVEKAISGDGIKQPSNSELKNLVIARKSIHLSKHLNKGQELAIENIIMKRPGDGISPMEIDKVIGKRVNKELPAEYKLCWEDIIE